jgi:hypothetical protein
MSDLEFKQLAYATRLVSGETRYFEQVSEWGEKRSTLLVQLEDIPYLLEAHRTRKQEPYARDPRIQLVDYTPTTRLANACEATANCLYAMAEIAANFANKASAGEIPASFNRLRKKCEINSASDIATALGDLQWYGKIRELRTEWAHYSSIFIAEDESDSTIICVRAYRRQTDRVQFQAANSSCTVHEFVGWVRKAIATLDSFAHFLLKKYVIPTFQLDKTIICPVYDENGFPLMKDGNLISVETISIRECLRRGGIVVKG